MLSQVKTLKNQSTTVGLEFNVRNLHVPTLRRTEPRYKDADYGLATQRDCLARPPSDGKERCAYVKYNRKEVYMCFCKGDLCNGATLLTPSAAAGGGLALMSALTAVLVGLRH